MPTPKSPPGAPERSRPKLLFDWEDWLPYMEEFDGTEAEKLAFIKTFWWIIQAFVDLGWEIDSPTSNSAESSGQVIDLTAELRAAVVDWSDQQQPEKEKEREGV